MKRLHNDFKRSQEIILALGALVLGMAATTTPVHALTVTNELGQWRTPEAHPTRIQAKAKRSPQPAKADAAVEVAAGDQRELSGKRDRRPDPPHASRQAPLDRRGDEAGHQRAHRQDQRRMRGRCHPLADVEQQREHDHAGQAGDIGMIWTRTEREFVVVAAD